MRVIVCEIRRPYGTLIKCSAAANAEAALELHAIRMSFGFTRAILQGREENPGTEGNACDCL